MVGAGRGEQGAPRSLTPEQMLAFREAMCVAYPTRMKLRMLVYAVWGEDLGEYSESLALRDLVFELLIRTDQSGRLPELVDAVVKDKGSYPAVRKWVTDTGWSRSVDSVSYSFIGAVAVGAVIADPEVAGSLERTLRVHAPYLDPVSWSADLAAIWPRVCRVEFAGPTGNRAVGTGFLVAADLCLTAAHVLQDVRAGTVSSRDVVLRFDYRRSGPGEPIGAGSVFGLATEWLAAWSQGSSLDDDPDAGNRVPDPGQVDCALLRVAGAPGEERGWIPLEQVDAVHPADEIVVLQHPSGQRLMMTFGAVLDINANATRMRHTANTEPGTSGSPIFTAGLQLVGLHQGGDPDRRVGHRPTFNRAVPIAAILRALGRELGA